MYDITALGEILIDFTYQGISRNGQKLFAQNPGGAPANALTSAARFGAKTAFLGKAGTDMHGRFLKEILEKEQIDTRGILSWMKDILQRSRSWICHRKENVPSHLRESQGQIRRSQRKNWIWKFLGTRKYSMLVLCL